MLVEDVPLVVLSIVVHLYTSQPRCSAATEESTFTQQYHLGPWLRFQMTSSNWTRCAFLADYEPHVLAVPAPYGLCRMATFASLEDKRRLFKEITRFVRLLAVAAAMSFFSKGGAFCGKWILITSATSLNTCSNYCKNG
ncbi:MAG: hypothetical protein IPM82_20395 [Saprospiraceae bacterium]|nr:hypothetical protein [Saprospiraceae bacterium]